MGHRLFAESIAAHRYSILKQEDPKPDVALTCATGDEKGFWLGSTAGLIFFDPKSDRVETWFPPVGPLDEHSMSWIPLARSFQDGIRKKTGRRPGIMTPATRLPGGVKTLLSQGSLLWIASEEHVLLMHKPSRKWVGQLKTGVVRI